MNYEIQLPIFQGPFDLLLFFIERDELDIYDIPIAKITDDFLEYMNTMLTPDMEYASDFIWVAASLMRIKAKMLLPRPETDSEGNTIDPRKELIRQLIEYKRLKPAFEFLEEVEKNALMRIPRGNVEEENTKIAAQTGIEINLQNVDLYKLLMAYKQAMENYEYRTEAQQIRSIMPYAYSIEGQKGYILDYLHTHHRLNFLELIGRGTSKIFLIFTFLAGLEMLQNGLISIAIEEGYNAFTFLPLQEK